MLSCPDHPDTLPSASSHHSFETSAPSGVWRLAEGFLHLAAVLSLGMLAVAVAVVGLIWFSMGLPNG